MDVQPVPGGGIEGSSEKRGVAWRVMSKPSEIRASLGVEGMIFTLFPIV